MTYWVCFYSFLNRGGEGKEAETQNEIFTRKMFLHDPLCSSRI